ncbi:hypothetical protein M271_21500 [Streptomyces rapamycinicus NRRL 5491]|nr:hypothetical protein M271_21500 [Streptomyces rapamycinicus NRRL 5491]
MGEQGGRVTQVGREVPAQGAAYGLGGGAPLQPGGDGGGEAAHVPLRQE